MVLWRKDLILKTLSRLNVEAWEQQGGFWRSFAYFSLFVPPPPGGNLYECERKGVAEKGSWKLKKKGLVNEVPGTGQQARGGERRVWRNGRRVRGLAMAKRLLSAR